MPLQQKPPGWLTSMTPSKTPRVAGSSWGASAGAVLMTLPSRMTSTVTRSSWAKPATSTKSREGKSVNARPPAGGSLTGTETAGLATAFAVTSADMPERLPTSSCASTV